MIIRVRKSVAWFCSFGLLLSACGTKHEADTPDAALTGDAGPDFGNSHDDAAVAATTDADTAGNTDAGAVVTVPCGTANAAPINKVDLIFMVDNSNSMRDEQLALKAQFPKLINVLTTGKRSPNDPHPFPPVTDLHLAVVSSDMGLLRVSGVKGCDGYGDDGLMRDPEQTSCGGGVDGQRFLAFKAGETDATELAKNFGCLADLGTGGCGFEQQLESTLKALWPKVDIDAQANTIHTPNRVTFLTDGTESGTHEFGHGDVENKGFLRTDPSEGLSVLGIVLVTDEEDCSSRITDHFKLPTQLSPSDPNSMVDLDLRCYRNPQNLYDLEERYLTAFRALRGGAADLVVYGAIVGVPPDLVTAEARSNVDFSNGTERDAYYDRILDDPRMQAVEDPDRKPGNGNLKTSCESATGRAYPPVRIVKLAKAFGENSFVQSICQSDFGPAVDLFIDKLSDRLVDTCVPE